MGRATPRSTRGRDLMPPYLRLSPPPTAEAMFTWVGGPRDSRGYTRTASAGARDNAFAVGGRFTSNTGPTTPALATAVDGSGDVYVGGDFSGYQGAPANRIIRLNSNGSVVSTLFVNSQGFDYGVVSIASA